MKRLGEFFRILIAVILAIIVFYISFAWTASCRLEKEYIKQETIKEGKNADNH